MIRKENYYEFWQSFYPEIQIESILELYTLFTNECLDNELEEMLKIINESDIEFDDEYVNLYFKYQRLKLYEEIHSTLSNTLYYNFYKPFINFLMENIFSDSKLLYGIGKNKLLLNSIAIGLLKQIIPVAGRVLVQETEYAKKSNRLYGNNKNDRFNYYNETLLNNERYLRSIFIKYSEILEIIFKQTKEYLCFIMEVFENIYKSNEEISKLLGIDVTYDNITYFEVGVGDTHTDGKSTIIINFKKGKKIVYKPRSLKLDKKFNDLLEWVNSNFKEQIGNVELKTYSIIDCGEYGFTEYVDYKPCDKIEEIERYYIRTGYLLAILHSLNATDIHHENIIACGEYPIVIDLETILHPIESINYDLNNPEEFYLKKTVNSIERIGMIPFLIKNKKKENIDLSGLGATNLQESPIKGYVLKNRGSEDICIRYDYFTINTEKNNPIIDNKLVDSDEFTNEILNGFRLLYLTIMKYKTNYIKFIQENFTNVDVRVILKSTMIYSTLIDASYHPDLLMDKLSRKVLLCRIGIEEENNNNNDIKEYEFKELMKGHIPSYRIKSNSKDLILGHVVSQNYYLKSPLDQVVSKIKEFSIEDLEIQEKYINMAYKNKKAKYDLDRTEYCFGNNKISESINIDTLMDSIAEYLVDQSINYGNNYSNKTWIGATFNEDDRGYTKIGHIGSELYVGEAGIALFFIYYANITGKNEYYKYAKEAMNYNINFIKCAKSKEPYLIGAFNGLGGRLYPIVKMFILTNDIEYRTCIIDYLDYIKEIIDYDKNYDVISGSSGLLLVLLSIKENIKDKEIIMLTDICVEKCVKHLVNNVIQIDNYSTWQLNIENKDICYTGFGHGNAGIIAAIARYSYLYNTNKYNELINTVIKYQDKMYNSTLKNWYKDSNNDTVANGWCHGVTGILLSQLLLIKYGFKNSVSKDLLNQAILTTINMSFGNNPSLCHGDFGNLEILLFAAKILKNNELEKRCMEGYEWILNNVVKNRWNGKSFRGIDILGMMVGVAGFGYSAMKFSYENYIPSILWLE